MTYSEESNGNARGRVRGDLTGIQPHVRSLRRTENRGVKHRRQDCLLLLTEAVRKTHAGIWFSEKLNV